MERNDKKVFNLYLLYIIKNDNLFIIDCFLSFVFV